MRTSSERGSAAVEFVLLGVPMVLVGLLIAQVLWLGHQRELLQDAAIESASFAALADQSVAAARLKATELFEGAEVEAELLESDPKAIRVTLTSRGLVDLVAVGYAVLELQK